MHKIYLEVRVKTPYNYIPFISSIYRDFRRIIHSYTYSGSGVFCPICSREFVSWLHNHKDEMCPYCRTVCRHRMLCLYLQNFYKSSNNVVKVLFFAPDWGLERWFRLHNNFQCVTTDQSAPNVDFHADITNLFSVENDSYDLVICCHVLEHVPNDLKAISELFRILCDGGTALIQVPYNPSSHTDEDPSISDPLEREQHFGQFDHVRSYGHDIINRLRMPGFMVEKVNLFQNFETHEAKRLGLWDDTIFVCEKPQKNTL